MAVVQAGIAPELAPVACVSAIASLWSWPWWKARWRAAGLKSMLAAPSTADARRTSTVDVAFTH